MGVHCLIIEDEANAALFIRKGLKEAGYIVTCCHEAVEGLHSAIGKQWDHTIVDRMSPGNIDSLSIVNTFREFGKKAPVLILTALASLDERAQELCAGGDDYLIKPFAFSQLLARVEELTRRRPQLQNRKHCRLRI
jgi:two-component system OmpR family response regulator